MDAVRDRPEHRAGDALAVTAERVEVVLPDVGDDDDVGPDVRDDRTQGEYQEARGVVQPVDRQQRYHEDTGQPQSPQLDDAHPDQQSQDQHESFHQHRDRARVLRGTGTEVDKEQAGQFRRPTPQLDGRDGPGPRATGVHGTVTSDDAASSPAPR